MENRFRDLRKTLTEELRNEQTGEVLYVAVERGLLDFYSDDEKNEDHPEEVPDFKV